MTVTVALGWVSLQQFGGILVQRPFPRSLDPLIRHILRQVPQYLSEFSTFFGTSFDAKSSVEKDVMEGGLKHTSSYITG